MRKIVRFGILMFATMTAAMPLAAPKSAKKPCTAADGAKAKMDAWKSEVKKMEASPVAEGFAKWTGLDSVKGKLNMRQLGPSDLRGRFVVIVELDKDKVVEQFKVTRCFSRLGFIPDWKRDWEFELPNRDVVIVYNVHELSEDDLDKQICNSDDFKGDAQSRAYNFYGNVTFDGAPDSSAGRPYVYVMAPEGKDLIFKGKFESWGKTFGEAKAAIESASSKLPAWRPWYGFVNDVKYVKGFDAAVAGGRGLAQFMAALKKGIASKKPDVAAESQRLFDAIEQRKADLLWQIENEWRQGPCAAMYDIEELSKRFPAMKRELAPYSEQVAKAHPDISMVYKHYALYRRCSAPDFRIKNASEAKKLIAELEKTKPVLKKLSNDAKDVKVQNVALMLLQRIDEVIEELPMKVMQN